MWLVFVSGVAEPLFYLLSVGIGLGVLIGTVPGPGGHPVPYREFVAPGLLAVSALNGAMYDSTFNVYVRLKFEKLYDAVLATPMRPAQTWRCGEIGWAVLRGILYAVPFMLVMVALGLVALPVGAAGAAGRGPDRLRHRRRRGGPHHVHEVLAGLRVRGAGRGAAVPVLRHVLSAVASTRGVRVIVEWTPLYQGVVMLRDLVLGRGRPGLLWRAAYLAAIGAGGVAAAGRRIGKLLLRLTQVPSPFGTVSCAQVLGSNGPPAPSRCPRETEASAPPRTPRPR